MKTVYIIQGFNHETIDGLLKIVGDPFVRCQSENEAVQQAERLSEIRVGSIAAVQEYDEDTGKHGKFRMLAMYGETPPELFGEDV